MLYVLLFKSCVFIYVLIELFLDVISSCQIYVFFGQIVFFYVFFFDCPLGNILASTFIHFNIFFNELSCLSIVIFFLQSIQEIKDFTALKQVSVIKKGFYIVTNDSFLVTFSERYFGCLLLKYLTVSPSSSLYVSSGSSSLM